MSGADAVNPRVEPPVFYARALALGVEIRNHESDLYLPVTPETTALIRTYRFREGVTQFHTTPEGSESRWYAIPFAYQPFWDERNAGRAAGEGDG